jgi:hypothetical protein
MAMNAQTKIKAATPSPAYEADGYGWAMAQAELLRARRFDAVDWNNVIEEIESVGKSERSSVESALRVVLMHQLKWSHQKMFRSRSWANSIRTHLQHFDDRLGENPGLKSQLSNILQRAYRDARSEAANETGIDIDTFPAEIPTWDEIRAPREL